MKSGHYVQIKAGEEIDSLAKDLGIPKEDLLAANPGIHFTEGEWVFAPLKRGVIYQDWKRLPASINPMTYSSEDMLWPVPASKRVTSNFGKRWGRKHEGMDIAARSGSNILAAMSGIVVYSGNGIGGYGNITVISHMNGLFTVYAHAKKNFTRKGERVHKGQVIAQVGTTGRSTGPHLHFEVRKDSIALDPQKMVGIK